MSVNVGDMAHVEYNTGEVFDGTVTKVRLMNDGRTLFTMNTQIGYRSMYLDRCIVFTLLP